MPIFFLLSRHLYWFMSHDSLAVPNLAGWSTKMTVFFFNSASPTIDQELSNIAMTIVMHRTLRLCSHLCYTVYGRDSGIFLFERSRNPNGNLRSVGDLSGLCWDLFENRSGHGSVRNRSHDTNVNTTFKIVFVCIWSLFLEFQPFGSTWVTCIQKKTKNILAVWSIHFAESCRKSKCRSCHSLSKPVLRNVL